MEVGPWFRCSVRRSLGLVGPLFPDPTGAVAGRTTTVAIGIFIIDVVRRVGRRSLVGRACVLAPTTTATTAPALAGARTCTAGLAAAPVGG